MSLPEELRGPYRLTPAPENIFKVDTTSPTLDTKRVEDRHAVTTKVLRVSERNRLDLQVLSRQHCARVKDPLEQD